MTEPAEHRLSITTGELASMLGGDLVGPADVRLAGIEALSSAGPTDLSFVRSSAYAKDAAASNAAAEPGETSRVRGAAGLVSGLWKGLVMRGQG